MSQQDVQGVGQNVRYYQEGGNNPLNLSSISNRSNRSSHKLTRTSQYVKNCVFIIILLIVLFTLGLIVFSIYKQYSNNNGNGDPIPDTDNTKKSNGQDMVLIYDGSIQTVIHEIITSFNFSPGPNFKNQISDEIEKGFPKVDLGKFNYLKRDLKSESQFVIENIRQLVNKINLYEEIQYNYTTLKREGNTLNSELTKLDADLNTCKNFILNIEHGVEADEGNQIKDLETNLEVKKNHLNEIYRDKAAKQRNLTEAKVIYSGASQSFQKLKEEFDEKFGNQEFAKSALKNELQFNTEQEKTCRQGIPEINSQLAILNQNQINVKKHIDRFNLDFIESKENQNQIPVNNSNLQSTRQLFENNAQIYEKNKQHLLQMYDHNEYEITMKLALIRRCDDFLGKMQKKREEIDDFNNTVLIHQKEIEQRRKERDQAKAQFDQLQANLSILEQNEKKEISELDLLQASFSERYHLHKQTLQKFNHKIVNVLNQCRITRRIIDQYYKVLESKHTALQNGYNNLDRTWKDIIDILEQFKTYHND